MANLSGLVYHKIFIFHIIFIVNVITPHTILGCHTHSQQENRFVTDSPRNVHFIGFFKSSCLPGSLHPVSGECTKFKECSNGQWYTKDCPPGTAFDKHRSVCDHIYLVKCEDWHENKKNEPVQNLNRADTTLKNCDSIIPWHHKTDSKISLYDIMHSLIYKKCPQVTAVLIQSTNKTCLCKCTFYHQQNHFYPCPCDERKHVLCFKSQQGTHLPEIQVISNDPVPVPASNGNVHSNVTAVKNDTIYCPVELFGLFPHPFSNQKYLKCVNGRLYQKSCRTGFVFDFVSKFCVENTDNLFTTLPPVQGRYANEPNIETRMSDNLTFLKCPQNLSGTFIHPFSCNSYINCSSGGTKTVVCSYGEYFSFRKNKCDDQSRIEERDHVPCVERNEKTDSEAPYSLGVFCAPTGLKNYPHPQSLYKYVTCNNGKLEVNWCPRNKIFSLEEHNCVTESKTRS